MRHPQAINIKDADRMDNLWQNHCLGTSSLEKTTLNISICHNILLHLHEIDKTIDSVLAIADR